MAKFNQKIVDQIVQMIEDDMYTISEICRAVGINRKTLYEWKNTKPEFCEAMDEAIRHRDEMLVVQARMSLKKKLEGYTLVEEKLYYEPSKGDLSQMVLKKKIVKKKQIAPDNQAIKMVLEQEQKATVKEVASQPQPTVITVVDKEAKDELEDFIHSHHKSAFYQVLEKSELQKATR